MVGAQPASSTSGTAPAAPLNGTGKTSAAWNTPKHREEAESYRTRLTDQGFNPSMSSRRALSPLLEFMFAYLLTLGSRLWRPSNGPASSG